MKLVKTLGITLRHTSSAVAFTILAGKLFFASPQILQEALIHMQIEEALELIWQMLRWLGLHMCPPLSSVLAQLSPQRHLRVLQNRSDNFFLLKEGKSE